MMSDDETFREMRYMAGDIPPEDNLPEADASTFFREQYKRLATHRKFDIALRLDDITEAAREAGIPRTEIEEIFSEPLPAKIEDAKSELIRRLIGLEQSIRRLRKDPEARFSKAIECYSELKRLDRIIQSHLPKRD